MSSEPGAGQFAVEAERDPVTQKDLFDLACSRLDDLKLDFEEGDESEASLLRKVEDEPELRRALANRLKQMAREKYTTGSEEELADKTRTDIRLHNPRVDARIPIEIKLAGKWRAASLRERLENQLVRQYMGEAHYGIFLIVNRGGEKDQKRWRIDDRNLGFDDLVCWLRKEAKSIVQGSSTIRELDVIGIDLTKRGGGLKLATTPKTLPRSKKGRLVRDTNGPSKPSRKTGARAKTRRHK